MPAIRLPPAFTVQQSTATGVPRAVASFVDESGRAEVFVGVRMTHPRSYRDLSTNLTFYPPPTIHPPTSRRITVIVGQTVSLTIKVGLTCFLS